MLTESALCILLWAGEEPLRFGENVHSDMPAANKVGGVREKRVEGIDECEVSVSHNGDWLLNFHLHAELPL